jgi:hypothetical protein
MVVVAKSKVQKLLRQEIQRLEEGTDPSGEKPGNDSGLGGTELIPFYNARFRWNGINSVLQCPV